VGKRDSLEFLIAGTMDLQNWMGASPCHPYPTISICSIDSNPSIDIGIEHILGRMSVGIMPTDRNNGMPWTHPFQPILLQGAAGAMVRDLHDVDSFGPTILAHAPQSLLLHIGCEEYSVIAARQLDDNGTIVERMPFRSPAKW